MLFNSVEYLLLFLPIVFGLYFLLNKYKLYKFAVIFLLAASLIFYGSYKVEYVYILVVSIVFNYFLSNIFKRNLSPAKRKIVLILGIVINVAILIGFKYFVFLFRTYSNLIHMPFNAMSYIMPLGISFFTLQQISYIIDCYRGDVKEYNFFDYALFVSFFPQLVAGPIVRHQEMIPQFNDLSKRTINQENIFIGIFLITAGLFKKVLLADNFTSFIDTVVRYDLYKEFYTAWIFGLSKVLQGYFDFSGYCDMALGSAFLFNISLPWNFNSPYKAQSIIDYWARWNMTLVRFLKDYIYYPLEKNTKNIIRTCFNIMVVFFVYGLWKGTNPVNVVYGLLNGVLVCLNKILMKFNFKLPKVISIFITFITLICLTPFIGVSSFDKVNMILKSMFCISTTFDTFVLNGLNIELYPSSFNLPINLLLIVVCLYLSFISKNSTELAKVFAEKNNTFYTIILAVIFFISALYVTKSTEFLYFIF